MLQAAGAKRAEMMVDLLETTGEPLSDEMLHRWHSKILTGRIDLKDSGTSPVYQQTYGHEERAETLAAAMIETFLASDAGFNRSRRALHTTASKGD